MNQAGIEDLDVDFPEADGSFPFALSHSFNSQEFEKLMNTTNEIAMNISDDMLQNNVKTEVNQFNPQQLLLMQQQIQMQMQQQQQPQQQQQQQPPQLLMQPQPQQPQQPEQHQYRYLHQSCIPNLIPITNVYDFEVTVPQNSNVVYIQPKLYIKMNSKMTINVAYREQNHNDRLYVRSMIIFSNPAEMHQPVKRCANHRIAKNTNNGIPNDAKDASILKINDPKAVYFGFENGTIFSERLSVLVPLESSGYDDNGKIMQTIGLEFGCQNSCSSGINRKPTSIVFTLEKEDGELVGKSAIEFKVCSCPKRDSERDQREKSERKRKSDSSNGFPRGKKPKYQSMPPVKTEPEESESDSTNEQSANEQNMATASQTTTISMVLPTDMVPEILKLAFNMVAGRMAEDSKRPSNYDQLEKCLKDLKKARKQAEKKSA